MQANTNAADPNSWQYWTNVHANYCPHKQPYFLAWHRGYLYYLERQIRLVSGDVGFTLPYWDWFTNPHVPAEFTDQASGNPLYCPRLNTNVYSALDLSPWASSTVNFQRGTVNSFEEKFETAPHNPVHNIIGNAMATMQSPRDPIFYLHHANVDRLWHAWALPDGRTMPVPSDPYWAGTFTYASGLTILKEQTYSARTRLGYDYDRASRPTTMPPQAQVGRIIRVCKHWPFAQSPGNRLLPRHGCSQHRHGRALDRRRERRHAARTVDDGARHRRGRIDGACSAAAIRHSRAARGR
ncbi:tyrosinase family protein [Paraburkholderia caribensis]|uniref:Tyrosinase family protein n=1 Tax=Paraburkholderia caribensis TaxID=75105 RepID=A0A9Q6S7U7_9BURK|nr:tyrosinase family protein [Paraburkholderia caribensis]MCO4879158.1 tyrosinase family protein [Paraburkholderia caribensis]QLB66219.1 hypothetical protein A9O66_28640 [Paraburkholderia caribensis]